MGGLGIVGINVACDSSFDSSTLFRSVTMVKYEFAWRMDLSGKNRPDSFFQPKKTKIQIGDIANTGYEQFPTGKVVQVSHAFAYVNHAEGFVITYPLGELEELNPGLGDGRKARKHDRITREEIIGGFVYGV